MMAFLLKSQDRLMLQMSLNTQDKDMTEKQNAYDAVDLPDRLFKYYGFDMKLTKKRLSGEVFLACPYDFNDPCDCQREVKNNTECRVSDKGLDWLKIKLQELGYDESESSNVADSLLRCDDKLEEVHRRQLQRVGILCLTSNFSDSLMWGYYANNEGFCIEYDKTKIIKAIVIGFINTMDYETTRNLYSKEKYYQLPEHKTKDLKQSFWDKAMEFKSGDLKRIRNTFLSEQEQQLNKLNFVRNVFLKRVFAQSITYGVSPDGSPSLLFFDRADTRSFSKYYKKTKPWAHEKEFRIIVSLGGRKVIQLGTDCIKNIYLGCNVTNENVVSILHLLSTLSIKAGLYKMIRLKNGGLAPRCIKWQDYENMFNTIDIELKKLT